MTAEKKSNPKPSDWAKAEALWELGEVTRDEIAKKLGVTPTSVSMHMKKAGVKRGSKADEHRKRISEDITNAVANAASADANLHAQRIKETKDTHYKMSAAIASMAFGEILNAKNAGTPISVAQSNLKALDTAMTVMAKARIERWAVLGLDRPDAVDVNELPALVIEELTAEQIEELRERDFNNFEEMDLPEVKTDDVVQEQQPTA